MFGEERQRENKSRSLACRSFSEFSAMFGEDGESQTSESAMSKGRMALKATILDGGDRQEPLRAETGTALFRQMAGNRL